MLKGLRYLTVAAAFFLSAGCGSTAESQGVPTHAALDSPGSIRLSPGLVVVQDPPFTNAAPAPTVEKTESPAPNNVTTNSPPAAASAPAQPNAPGNADLSSVAGVTENLSTNVTPVIEKEVPPALPENLKISSATEKIIKLADAGVDESVMLAWVEKTQGKFELEADEIVYLTDLGVPSSVVSAMLKHDGVDSGKADLITSAPNTEASQPTLAAQPQIQPQPVEITTNYAPNGVYMPPPGQETVVVQQPQTVVVEQQPETVNYFYSSLAPYGSWMMVPDYGWCWQPTCAVVDHGWRPYGPRGNWEWTTSGWYWHSEYTWGWAPFHYGRWYVAGSRGWVWVPDHTWGPAWVSWRTTPDYCGWAPLPPAAHFTPGIGFSYYGHDVGVSFGFGLSSDLYCFAPVSHFHDHHVYNYALPAHRAHTIYASSVVNNRYDWGRDHRVVNNGIPRERVERAVNHEIRPTEIRDTPQHEANRFGPREHLERNGQQAVIYRPTVPRADMADAINRQTSPAPAAAAGVGTGAGVRTPNARFPNNGFGRNTETWQRDRAAQAMPAQSTTTAPMQPAASVPTTTTPAPGVERRGPVNSPQQRGQPARDNYQYRRDGSRGEIERSVTAPGVTTTPPQFTRRDLSASSQMSSPPPQVSSPAPQISSPPPQTSAPRGQVSAPPGQVSATVVQSVPASPARGYEARGYNEGYRAPYRGSVAPGSVAPSTAPALRSAPSAVPRGEPARPAARVDNPAPSRGAPAPVQNNNAAPAQNSTRGNNVQNDMQNRLGRR